MKCWIKNLSHLTNTNLVNGIQDLSILPVVSIFDIYNYSVSIKDIYSHAILKEHHTMERRNV